MSTRAFAESLEPRRLLAAIASGQTINGNQTHTGQLDTYTFSVGSDHTFVFGAGATGTSGLNPALKIFAPDGTIVYDSYTGSNGISKTYTVPAGKGGTYTAVVSDAYNTTGTYSAELVIGPSTLAAGDGRSVSSGQTVSATIDRQADLDGYTFTANSGQSFVVSAGASDNSGLNPSLELIAPDGTVLYNSYTGGASIRTTYTVPAGEGGTYTAVVGEAYATTGTYDFELVKGPANLVNGDGRAVVSGQTVNASIGHSGDIDGYTFTVNPGQSFAVSAGSIAGSGLNPALTVIAADGSILYNSYTGGPGIGYTYTVPAGKGGSFTAIVGDAYGTSGGYDFEMIAGPATLAAGDGRAVASGQAVNASIAHSGDIDGYTFTAAAGQSFVFAAGASGNSALNPSLRVFGANGSVLYNSYTGGSSIRYTYTVPAGKGGSFTAVVGDAYGTSGAYDAELVVGPSVLLTSGDGKTITKGQTIDAAIAHTGDIDGYTFTATAGDSFVVSAAADSGSGLNPSLTIIAPDGVLVYNSYTGGSSIGYTYTIPSGKSGTYTAVVGDAYGTSGAYQFALSGNIRSVTPKVTVTAPAAQTASAGIAKTFDLGRFTSAYATSPYQVVVDWGDGSAKTSFAMTVTGTITPQAHTYRSDGSFEPMVTIRDAQGLTGSATFAVTVGAATNTASIAGTVFNDLDADGIKDTGEAGLAGVVLYNDANNNSAKDTGEATVTSDSSGNYKFSNLAAGTYKIRQVLPSGYTQTSPSGGLGQGVTVSAGQAATGKNFGDKPATTTTASISGTVFNDGDGDGTRDSGELGLGLWSVYLDANKNGKLDSGEKTATTDVNGAWNFAGLSAGTYVVRVVQVSGTAVTTAGSLTLTLRSGQASGGNLFGEKRIA